MTSARVGVAGNKKALKPSAPARSINSLREKIDEAKGRPPLPELLAQLGLGGHAKASAHCLWHDDQRPSFSVFKGKDGFWHYKCFVCDAKGGDEITFLVKHLGITRREAINRYLKMAGFPSLAPGKSREYPEALESPQSPECPESPESPEFPESPVNHVYPVSNGQEPKKDLLAEKDLKGLAARNACRAKGTARTRRFQLLRDLKAVELRHGAFDTTELMLTFDEWYRLSRPLLNSRKTRDDYLAAFLAEFGKVRVPTGEGQTIKEALADVSRLSFPKLPVIPDMPDAPEGWRRIAALHRDLSRRSANGTYFVTCRDTAKAFPGLSHQTAYNINLALAQLGVIKIVHRGDARPNGGRASEFRYLLVDADTRLNEDEQEVEI
jgi:CHC2 zinc finger